MDKETNRMIFLINDYRDFGRSVALLRNDTLNDLVLGRQYVADIDSDTYTSFAVDEILFWDKFLSTDEVRSIYCQRRPGGC